MESRPPSGGGPRSVTALGGLDRRAALLRWVLLAALLAAVAAAYLPSIDGEFVFDDAGVLRDPRVVDPFGYGVSPWLLPAGRPLTTFTFALNYVVVGLDTRGWHLTNVALHLVATLLAWLFCRLTLVRAGLSRPEGPALAAAGLFALHPLQTESVAYISQRAESLASGLYLAALLALLARDEETTRRRRNALLVAAVVLHAFGLAAKEIAATLPGAWLLHAALVPPPGEEGDSAWRRIRRRLAPSLPLLALSGLVGVVGVTATAGSPSAGFDIPGVSLHGSLGTQLRAISTYLRLLAWPAGQSIDWEFPAGTWLEPAALAGAALIGAIAAGAVLATVRLRSRGGDTAAVVRTASFGGVFFLLALAPSSVIPLRDRLAEHRVYLPSLGCFLAVSAGATLALRRIAPARAASVGAALAVVALGAAGAATARRNEVWSSPVALWIDAAEKSPHKARTHLNLGVALAEANRPAEALTSFRRARALRDHTLDEKLFRNIVATLVRLSRFEEARAEIDRDLAIFPGDPETLAMLAELEFAAGRHAESEDAAMKAIASDPGNVDALKFLALVWLGRGDLAGARRALRAAAANGRDTFIHWKLGEVEERAGAIDEACAAYARAARLPGSARFSEKARAARARLRCP